MEIVHFPEERKSLEVVPASPVDDGHVSEGARYQLLVVQLLANVQTPLQVVPGRRQLSTIGVRGTNVAEGVGDRRLIVETFAQGKALAVALQGAGEIALVVVDESGIVQYQTADPVGA